MDVQIRRLGMQSYEACLTSMKAFTETRQSDQIDEIWMVQHPSVFTLGKAARAQHLKDAGDIPVLATERGGQITYHGPGQVIAYVLLDLGRRGLMVRELVYLLEQSCIDLLSAWGLSAERRSGAPGVYLNQDQAMPDTGALQSDASQPSLAGSVKIAALGLKVSRSRCYHGIALNVAMNLAPFRQIDPCGYPGLRVTDMQSCLGYAPDCEVIETEFSARIAASLASHYSERRPV